MERKVLEVRREILDTREPGGQKDSGGHPDLMENLGLMENRVVLDELA